MVVAPLSPDQLPVSATDRVGRDRRREPISGGTEGLEDGQDQAFLRLEIQDERPVGAGRPALGGGPAAENPWTRRLTAQQCQPEDLADADGDQTEGHIPLLSHDQRVESRQAWPGGEVEAALAPLSMDAVLCRPGPELLGQNLGTEIHLPLAGRAGAKKSMSSWLTRSCSS
jgi:hypothetical protein